MCVIDGQCLYTIPMTLIQTLHTAKQTFAIKSLSKQRATLVQFKQADSGHTHTHTQWMRAVHASALIVENAVRTCSYGRTTARPPIHHTSTACSWNNSVEFFMRWFLRWFADSTCFSTIHICFPLKSQSRNLSKWIVRFNWPTSLSTSRFAHLMKEAER